MKQAVENPDVVSALADGQLHGDAFACALTHLAESEDARRTWHSYHVIGDILRAGDAVDSTGDSAFLQRLRGELAKETITPVRLDTPEFIAETPDEQRAAALNRSKVPAANDDRFRWKLWGAMASVALVSLGAWQALTVSQSGGASVLAQAGAVGQLAAAPPQASSVPVVLADASAPQVMVRDPRLDALLAAHQQFGGTSALQMPTGFIRNATFEGTGR